MWETKTVVIIMTVNRAFAITIIRCLVEDVHFLGLIFETSKEI